MLRKNPVWWLSLVLATILLSCFPEQLAEYLASQDVATSIRRHDAGSKSDAGALRIKATASRSRSRPANTKSEAEASAAPELSSQFAHNEIPIINLPSLPTAVVDQSTDQPDSVETPATGPVPASHAVLAEKDPPRGSGDKIPVRPEAELPDEMPSSISLLAELPGADRLFRMESESSLQERMRQEMGPTNPLRQEFPPEKPIRATKPAPARDQAHVVLVEPAYVAYRTMLFEDDNTERFGWEVGHLQPLLSAGHFYLDLFTADINLAMTVVHPIDTGAGKCLPGDPVPYLWNLPVTVTTNLKSGCPTGHRHLH